MVSWSRIAALDRKLLRDLWRMRGQVVAIAMVAMCGVATLVTMRGAHESLLHAQAAYYERYRFADVFCIVKGAPIGIIERVRSLPGVAQADARVVHDASLDVPGLEEPASGRLVSLPRHGGGLNRVHLRSGRMPLTTDAHGVLVSEAFSAANGLKPGDSIGAIINGRKERLLITGIAISPEYVNEIKGNSFPDNRRFGVLWMNDEALAAALGMRDAINDITLTLAPGASEKRVIELLDRLLAPYGSLGAYGRDEQISHNFLANELAQSRVSAIVIPTIFLGVSAFLIHNVLQRLTALQRAQIGLMRSFGYGRAAIGAHVLKFALFTVIAGAVPGIGVGAWLGGGLARLYARFYHFPSLAFRLSAFTVALALLSAVASAAIGAWLAARAAMALAPAEAMRPEAPARFRPGPMERLGLQRFMPLSLRMVLRNLERNAMKSLMSIVGLACALALVIAGQFTFDALNEIIRIQFQLAQRDDVTVSFNEARDISVAHDLAALPGVLRVEPFRNAAVRMRYRHHSKKTVVFGLPQQRQLRTVLDEQERPIALPAKGIVMTRKLAETLGIGTGEALTLEFLQGQRRIVAVPVARIVDEPIGMFSYMDAAALAELASEPVTADGAYLAIDAREAGRLYRALKGVPAAAAVNLRVATLQSFLSTVAQNMRMNTMVLVVFACVIALGVVYNAMRIALSEGAIELASLRILGFTTAEVATMLLGQQAVLVLAALPLGCLLGYGLAALLSLLLSQDLFRIPLVISSRTFGLSIGAVLLSALIAGAMAWRRLRRLDLIAVLKTRE
ncbi:ABC transporter permease [Noviherbaspirillum pedocola]|uniref:FtsX-like permease family protein n=1 Tax=Noviherbaspirillum pedocola TaxID=2801341 RepID=A0A934W6E6_9BURK|nr:FtsX-like permease family protein [Noviherbaspirillum pedocola]MBK4735025.1 FtsX-like permease family protein [Noviherbaspirillum pedocola]